MTLELQTTLHGLRSDGTSFEWTDALISSGSVYTVTAEPRLKIYNIETGAVNYADGSNGTGSYSGITLIAASSAIISNRTSSRFDIVNLADPNYQKTGITTSAVTTGTTFNNYQNQIAGHPTAKLALSTRSSTGGVQLINANPSTPTITQLTPSQLTGLSSVTTIKKDTGDTWLVGTNGGTIVEIASTGSVIQSVSIPTTPNGATPSPLPVVGGLASYADYVVASSNHGALYLIQWSASAVLDVLPWEWGSTTAINCTLSQVASGYLLAGRGFHSSSEMSVIRELDISTGKFVLLGQWFKPVSIQTQTLKLDPTNRKAVALYDTTAADNMQIFNIPALNKINVSTRVQDSSVDISARIIRIREGDTIGRAFIESDQNISAGETDILATNGYSYVEVAIKSGSPEKYDIREFRA